MVVSPTARPALGDRSRGWDTPERVTCWIGVGAWATLCALQSSNMTSESIPMGVQAERDVRDLRHFG